MEETMPFQKGHKLNQKKVNKDVDVHAETTDLPVNNEDVNDVLIEATEAINQYVNENVFKVNENGNNMYECLGITPEEMAYMFGKVKEINRMQVTKAMRTQELVNLLLSNKKYIAVICWLNVKL